ncbi:MAG TPA: PIN domain-containing protein [Candidatus Nanoarchaeia archaeon]|nr:PIN domain-containing protein [Candidatus Nanoarchaeia archaeon]
MTKFFYDSYAIIEFVNGNEKFRKYFLENDGITTLYNAMEVYYSVLKEKGEAKANETLKLLAPIVFYPTLEYVEDSMKFRLKHKEKKLSYADCLGYAIALKLKIKFLTGDEDFRNVNNVEFLKA